MGDPIHFFTAAVVLGIVSGISPGPLLTLIISETIRYDKKAGIKMALVPLTDPPIIFICLFVLAKFADVSNFLGTISFAGALFLCYLAFSTFKAGHNKLDIRSTSPNNHAFRKGVIANMLSPHPYLFWITVGGPAVIKTSKIHIGYAITYIGLFYIFLIGSKILIALLVHRSKKLFDQKKYAIIMHILGIALAIFAILLIKEGLNYLNGQTTTTR